MDPKIFLYIGGAYHIGFSIFDLSWPYLFNWKKTLEPLDDMNAAVYRLTSKLLVLLFWIFAYISFVHTDELLTTGIGKTLMVSIAIFWSFRFLMQLYFFGLFKKANTLNFDLSITNMPFQDRSKQQTANTFLPIFLLGIASYLVPWLMVM